MACTRGSRILQIHPTRRCNLRCLHCYSLSGPEEGGGLAVALLQEAIRDAAAEEFAVVSVSGGEPLLYEPLPELLAHAHACGLVTTVTSNGMLLDERRLGRLAGLVDLLAISLDGMPEAHNRMRANPRAFTAMAAHLPRVRSSGIPFGFIFTLTQYNLHELEWVAAFAVEQGARLLQIHPLEITGRAVETISDANPDGTEAAYAFVVAHHLQEALGAGLQVQLDLVSRRGMAAQPGLFFAEDEDAAGTGGPLSERVRPLVIEADGTVVPLEHGFGRHLALGNLHDAPLRELAPRWLAERYPEFRRLCRRAFEAVTNDAEAPIANWSEALRRAEDAALPS
jgi:MoaA/NifB/PqqE/SkfB family radical SAM enzyme